jgi:hypothetical protein
VRGDQLAPGPCPQGIPAVLTDRPRGRPLPRRRGSPTRYARSGIGGAAAAVLGGAGWADRQTAAPGLPELLANLSAHGHLAETDSRAAIDRRLAGPHSTRLGGSPTGSID